MAENKKSFVLYCDLINTIENLTEEEAGRLFIHIIKYVNDKNPEPPDRITQIAFEPIKQQLKRDLLKWEEMLEKRSKAGKASAIKRQQVSTHVESVEHTSTNSTVNGTVNVNVSESNINSKLSAYMSHDSVVANTLKDELFMEDALRQLSAKHPSLNKTRFSEYVVARLDLMKTDGSSSKYPLGTIRRILITDYEKSAKSGTSVKTEQVPTFVRYKP